MTDVHSIEVRSYNMSQIKGRNTKPEMIVRKFLFSQGFRYRINIKSLPGTPDIVLSKFRTVIFIHGCFWHGHDGCNYFVIPKTRTEWWTHKIKKTKDKDSFIIKELIDLGWKVLVIWECNLRGGKRKHALDAIINSLKTIN